MTLGAWEDGSVVEAASWRLASELCRRHPGRARLFRGHPGGGMYDVLWIIGSGPGNHLDIRLNRVGTIQVHGRFDGCPPEWPATPWDEYLRSDPRMFLY